jgi:hypothetical protein
MSFPNLLQPSSDRSHGGSQGLKPRAVSGALPDGDLGSQKGRLAI